jgi:hypothetical protein
LSFFEDGRTITAVFQLSGASIVRGREADKRGRIIAVSGKDDKGICGFAFGRIDLNLDVSQG